MLKTLSRFVRNNSSTILTVLSLAGVVGTVVTASQDTAKAKDVITITKPRNRKEAIRVTWKCYIPTAISAGTTMACILGSHYCSQKQKEALSSAYALSQLTLQKYQEKVVDRIGKNKAESMRQEVMNEVAEYRSPVAEISTKSILPIDTGHGTTLFYDIPTDTWFYSDKTYLDNQVNQANQMVLTEGVNDLNEIRYRWGLPQNKLYSEWLYTATEFFEPKFQYDDEALKDTGQVRVNIYYEMVSKSDYLKRGRKCG